MTGLHKSAATALLLSMATNFVAAQSNAESIQLVIPRGPVQQGANVSLGFTDGSSSQGNNNEGAFTATRICIYGPDGSPENDCAKTGYVSFSIASLSINDTTGDWNLPTQKTCVTSSQISGSATYSFGFNTGNWTLGNSTAVYERIIIYGSNGTTSEPNPSTPSNGLTCIYPPFTRQIVQANGTVQVIDPPANGQPQVVQTTTSSASFATTEPRPNTGGAGRHIGSSSMTLTAGLLVLGGLALVGRM